MMLELDRVCDQIEWEVGANEVAGSLITRHKKIRHKVKLRLKGFHPVHRRARLAEAQVSIALSILRDSYNDVLLPTHRIDLDVPDDDKQGKKPGAGGGRGRKSAGKKAGKAVGSGGDAGGSDD